MYHFHIDAFSEKMGEKFGGDFDSHDETVFQARFGNRWYSWSFDLSYMHAFENWSSGFQWREESNRGDHRTNRWETLSVVDSDDEPSSIGAASDRVLLGLPATGALKLEDVKNAFRLTALRWHPDKHQGPSQSMAEEKFKLCVNAYKSLCSAFSSADRGV
ncbi:hypothetical protein MLD38_012194 [Melastoma candidum]|uniref:Uncharacterized protein n=1 Tax=Melastoma candidum TaxID=119954 RepID=A0ACB9R5M1_9MYRT|nr:hypothetical protein MLD38_012194 [Melastoma candidum]